MNNKSLKVKNDNKKKTTLNVSCRGEEHSDS